MRVGAGCLGGGGVTFIDRLRRWPLLACVNGPPSVALESGGLRGGPGRARGARLGSKMSPRAVPNQASGGPNWASGSQTWCLRAQNYNRRSGVGAKPPPIPKNKRSRGEAPPGPATRRPSKTLRWRDANVEPFEKKATRRRGEALPSVAIGSSSAMVTSWHGSAGQSGAWSGRSPARYWQPWRQCPARWRCGGVALP